MKFYILRHGLAEDLSSVKSGKDADRRLTPEGIRKIKRVAKGMKALKIDLDLIFTSPFARAQETAQLVAGAYGLEKETTPIEPLAPDGSPKELVEQLRAAAKKRGNVLLVGHEPYLSRLISLLISGDTAIPITLKKGGLCHLSVKGLRYGRCATLEWLLTPGQNRRMQG